MSVYDCPVCKDTGVVEIPKATGGVYEVPCGACGLAEVERAKRFAHGENT